LHNFAPPVTFFAVWCWQGQQDTRVGFFSVQDVRLITLTPLTGSRSRVATTLARAIGDNDLLIMLSGPEGSGKSAILAAVVATLAYGGMRVIRVSNPDDATMGQRELAARILGRPTMGSPAQLVAEAITNLLATTDDGQVVLVVDDAHTLSDQAMELLLVIASPARRGIRAPQLVLAGRGDFWDRPWRDELRAITDVAEKIKLEPLTTADARDFVMNEAKASGGSITSATPDALTALVRCSSGLNAQMDRIVTAAVALGNRRGASDLTEEIVDAAVTPDTLLEPPCTGAGPLNVSDEPATMPTAALPTPIAARKLPLGWLAIAAAAVLIVAGVSVGLVSRHTQVTPSIEQGTPETTSAPAPTSEAVTAPEPPKVEQLRPANEAMVGAASTTPGTASTAASPPSIAPASPAAPSVSPSPNVVAKSELPAAAQEVVHPPANTTASAERPVASAPQPAEAPDRAADATPPTNDAHGRDQPAAPPPVPSDTANDTQAVASARPPEAAKLETPAAPPVAPSASVDTRPGQPQPVIAPPTAPPAVPPLPFAPPPVAALPVIPPPVAALPVIPPPAATPPMVQPPAAQSQLPSAPQVLASLPPKVIAVLLQHGDEKLASGDILSARLYFERAGAAGSEEGAMNAGKTYDPEYLAKIDAPGLQADAKRAIDWYRIAASTHGNSEAQKRIDALTAAGTAAGSR
jgi:type II secretory pathway predicted ATPase ExeA